jgi:hypothetical protein
LLLSLYCPSKDHQHFHTHSDSRSEALNQYYTPRLVYDWGDELPSWYSAWDFSRFCFPVSYVTCESRKLVMQQANI